jgi:large subunit ribosomal protein L4
MKIIVDNKTSNIKVDNDITTSDHILHQALRVFTFNRRHSHSNTLTKGEVSGTNKKPWKQKGTGRARVGYARNPIWRHGSVVFGPRAERNYKLSLSKTSKKVALSRAIILKSEDIIVSDSLEAQTTKMALSNVLALGADLKRRLMIVIDNADKINLNGYMNLSTINIVTWQDLNAADIVSSNTIICSHSLLDNLKKILKTEKGGK